MGLLSIMWTGFTILHHLVKSCNEDGDEDSDDDEQDTGQEYRTKVYSHPFDLAMEDVEEDDELTCEEYALGLLNQMVEAQPEIHVGDVNQEGKNVLHYSRFVEVSKRLLEISSSEQHNQQSRLDVDASDRKGRTPLHIACKQTNSQLVRLLLEHGASVLMTTKSTEDKPSGETPWEVIVDDDDETIVDEVDIGASLACLSLLKDYELVQPKMLHQAHNALERYPGLSGQVLERLFRAGPVGRSVAFELLPFLLASGTLPCGRYHRLQILRG